MEVWSTKKSPHERKDKLSFVEELMENEASKELPGMQKKVGKAKK